MTFSVQQGSCSCGANRFRVTQAPIAHFYCHCSICQAYNNKPYADVAVFLKSDVIEDNLQHTEFKRYRLPPNIQRGKCSQCHQPSLEKGMLDQLVLMPVANLQNPEQLQPASAHVFYDCRVTDVYDNVPKYTGYLKSQGILSYLIGKGLLQHLRSTPQ